MQSVLHFDLTAIALEILLKAAVAVPSVIQIVLLELAEDGGPANLMRRGHESGQRPQGAILCCRSGSRRASRVLPSDQGRRCDFMHHQQETSRLGQEQ